MAEPQIADTLRRLPNQYIKLNTIEPLYRIMVKSSLDSLAIVAKNKGAKATSSIRVVSYKR